MTVLCFRPIRSSDKLIDMIDWCLDNIGKRGSRWDNWEYYDRMWYFPNGESATLFLLRWGA